MTETENTPPQPMPDRPSYALMNPPDQVARYLEAQRAQHTDESSDPRSISFAEFIANMERTNFEDVYDIRAILESQAQMLGAVFQYVLMDGDWRNLPFALRAQKMMLDTIDTMNGYPSLSYRDDMLRRIHEGEI